MSVYVGLVVTSSTEYTPLWFYEFVFTVFFFRRSSCLVNLPPLLSVCCVVYLKRAVLKYHYQERKLPLHRATLVRRPELLLSEVTILLYYNRNLIYKNVMM
jgi:glucose-6-phosphate-specific signal transduction histidine kinase